MEKYSSILLIEKYKDMNLLQPNDDKLYLFMTFNNPNPHDQKYKIAPGWEGRRSKEPGGKKRPGKKCPWIKGPIDIIFSHSVNRG